MGELWSVYCQYVAENWLFDTGSVQDNDDVTLHMYSDDHYKC